MIMYNELLASYTSWRIGGPAKTFFHPDNHADLQNFLQALPLNENLFWLGLGSNVLIRDGGFDGTVIYTQKTLAGIEIIRNDLSGLTIKSGCGETCAKLARFVAKHGMVGGEFFAGIPGSVGGALAMNAGAWGGETWEHVVEVEVINRRGEIIKRKPSEYNIGYRTVVMPTEEWFLSATMQFKPGNAELAQQKIKELIAKRSATQPIGLLNCGSVFRNPEGKYAAELIEASKLKGRRIGNAEVSPKHANFIINLGNAQAKDVETLIEEIKYTINKDHGVMLETEVRIIGT